MTAEGVTAAPFDVLCAGHSFGFLCVVVKGWMNDTGLVGIMLVVRLAREGVPNCGE